MESTVLTNMEQAEVVDNWNLLAKSNSHYLAKELKCSDKTVKNILSLETGSLPSLADGTNCFVLNLSVRDTSELKISRMHCYTECKITIMYGKKWRYGRKTWNASQQSRGELTKLDSTRTLSKVFPGVRKC